MDMEALESDIDKRVSTNEILRRLYKKLPKKITAKELADKTGCHQTVFRWGRTPNQSMTTKNLLKIAEGFDLSTDYLLGREKTAQEEFIDSSKKKEKQLKHINEASISWAAEDIRKKITDLDTGRSIKDICVEAHVDPGVLYRKRKQDGYGMQIGTICKIAEVLDVTPDYLLGFASLNECMVKDILYKKWRMINEQQKKRTS